MEDGARRKHRKSNLASIEQSSERRHFTSELPRIGRADESYGRGGDRLEEERHDHEKREPKADCQAPPSWNRE